MQTCATQLTDVIYNAGTQCFEALVSVQEGNICRKYACAIEAPITMSFSDAAKGLSTQAMRRHAARGGLKSEVRRHAPKPRAGRAIFDPMGWLESFMHLPGRKAA